MAGLIVGALIGVVLGLLVVIPALYEVRNDL